MNNSDLTQQFVSLANQAAGLQGQGKLDAAVACYRQALALVPGHPVVLSNLGNALRRRGEYAEALRCQQQAVQIDAHNGWFLANLALAQRSAGQPWLTTLAALRDEPLVEPEIRMWAALNLDQPEKAFAFRPKNLNVMDYADLRALYRPADLAARLGRLPSLGGTMPHRTARPLIYAGGDGVYAARFAQGLITSALTKSPGCDVHIHLMNPGAFKPEEAFADFPAERLTWSIEDMGDCDKILYSSRRTLRLAQIQHQVERVIMLIDTDSMVNGDLAAALPAAFDVVLNDRSDEVFAHQMAGGGFIAVAPSGRDFADFLAAYILHFEEAGQPRWFDDQLNMVAAKVWFQKNVPGFSIMPAPPHMMDWTGTHRPESLIWHAKGNLK